MAFSLPEMTAPYASTPSWGVQPFIGSGFRVQGGGSDVRCPNSPRARRGFLPSMRHLACVGWRPAAEANGWRQFRTGEGNSLRKTEIWFACDREKRAAPSAPRSGALAATLFGGLRPGSLRVHDPCKESRARIAPRFPRPSPAEGPHRFRQCRSGPAGAVAMAGPPGRTQTSFRLPQDLLPSPVRNGQGPMIIALRLGLGDQE